MSNGIGKNPLLDISKVYLEQIVEKKDDSYLEPDMKKRQKNNEKARKELAKGPQMKNPHFEEKQQGWDAVNALAGAYKAMQEGKVDTGKSADAKATARNDRNNPVKGDPGFGKFARATFDRQKDGQSLATGKDSAASEMRRKAHDQRRGVKKEEVELDEADSLAAMAARREKRLAAQRKREGTHDDGSDFGHDYVAKRREANAKFGKKPSPKNEELELDENRAAARAAGGYKDDSKKQNDPSKAGFTGIGNMSIDQIRKMSARMDKEKKESYDPMDDPDFDHDEAEKNRGVSGKNNPKGGKALSKKKKMKEGLDPVGQEDGDIDNDGDKDKSDKYLSKRRKAIGKAIAKKGVKEDIEITEIHGQAHKPHEVPSKNLKGLVKKAVKRIDTDVDGDTDNNDKAKGELGEFIPGVGNKRLYSTTGTKTAKESFSNWRSELTEVSGRDGKEEETQIKEKNVKNKITIDPHLKLENIVQELGGEVLELIELDEETYEMIKEAVYGGTPPEKKDTRMIVTNADKKANTPAYQKMKAGDKRYKSADHMDEEKKPLPKNKMFRKAGNLGRDVVSPSVTDDQRQKAYDRSKKIVKTLNKANEEVENVEEIYKGKHGQTEKQYQDSRSDAGKMVSGDSKGSGANYSYRAKNTGSNPAGGSEKPQGQARMGSKDRAYLKMRKANLRKEETEDSLRDRRMERGGVDGNNRYNKPVSNTPNTFGKKKPAGGMSALEKVRASIRAKHGKGAIKEDAKMSKQSDEKLAALHKQVSASDQSLPSNQFMMKRVTKEMNRRKKA